MIFISGTGWVNGKISFSEKSNGSGVARFRIISSDKIDGFHEEIVLTITYWCHKGDLILTELVPGALIQFHGRLTKLKRVPFIRANAPLQILQEPAVPDIGEELPETDLEATEPTKPEVVEDFE